MNHTEYRLNTREVGNDHLSSIVLYGKYSRADTVLLTVSVALRILIRGRKQLEGAMISRKYGSELVKGSH